MTSTLDHPLLGKLTFDRGFYEKVIPFPIFGSNSSCKIMLQGDLGEAIEPHQEEAIRCYKSLEDRFPQLCEAAIQEHCRKLLEEETEPEPHLIVADSKHVGHYFMNFPIFFREPTWGLTCDTEWDDEGLGIKFVRDQIAEVGPARLLT